MTTNYPNYSLTAPARRQASTTTKLLYGVGDIATAIKSVLFNLFTLFFYTSVIGLPGALVGIATSIGLMADAFLAPYLGHISDNSRLRLGRRHSFMLAGGLCMGISLWSFFSPPPNLSEAALLVWLLITGSLVRITASVFGVPYFALGAELSQDYEGRTQVTAIRGGLALLGTLLTAGLSFVLFFPSTGSGLDPKLNPSAYSDMGLAAGVAVTAVALIAYVATLPWRSAASPRNDARTMPMGFLTSFRQILRLGAFRPIFLSASLFFFAVVVNGVLMIHFVTYYAGVTDSRALSSLQVALYLGSLAGVLSWFILNKRFSIEKQRLYVASAILTGLLMLGASVLLGEGNMLGTGNVTALTVGHSLAGLVSSVLWFIPTSMVADTIDQDELMTGQRREGVFFGLFFFGQKLATALAALTAGFLLDWFAGLVPGTVQQPALTIQRIGLIYSLLPALALFAAAALMMRYPLNRGLVAAIRAELDGRFATQ